MKPLANVRQIDEQQYQDAIHALAEDLVDGKKLDAVFDHYLPDILGYEGAVELDISDEFVQACNADIALRAKGGFFDFNAVMRDLYRRAAWNSVETQVERKMEEIRADRTYFRNIDSLSAIWHSPREMAAAAAGVSAYGEL